MLRLDELESIINSFFEDFDNFKMKLGEFDITFLNGTYKKPKFKFGENVNSVVTLIELNGLKALLAGDMNYKNGGEKLIADKVGKVDLLKVGHHGYIGSTSSQEYILMCALNLIIFQNLKFTVLQTAAV